MKEERDSLQLKIDNKNFFIDHGDVNSKLEKFKI